MLGSLGRAIHVRVEPHQRSRGCHHSEMGARAAGFPSSGTKPILLSHNENSIPHHLLSHTFTVPPVPTKFKASGFGGARHQAVMGFSLQEQDAVAVGRG